MFCPIQTLLQPSHPSPRLEKALGIGRAWPRLQVGVGRSAINWSSRGQSQGFIQKGQRSGVYTEGVGAFTVDSSGNPPACEEREQIQFTFCKHKEQTTYWAISTTYELLLKRISELMSSRLFTP